MALKGNTNRKIPIHVEGDIVKTPKELIKLHKYVFMTSYILFLNGITFFIFLSHKIMIHLSVRISVTLFKYFMEIYMYYMKCGFQITTLHVYGEFAPLPALIQNLPESTYQVTVNIFLRYRYESE